jgi:ribosomal protein S25
MLLFETGMDRSQVFAVARAAKCNKYARDGRSDKLLWKEVCRAYAKNEANNNIFVPRDSEEPTLLTDAERDRLRNAEDGFVERYQHWAKSVGDAAPQYHQAGAFMALSAIMCGSVRLPTSFGLLIPNLWFMILADTTLTRKTTAMDLAMDLVTEIDPEIVMATDGSIEGLLSVLAVRPNKPSVFLRDEFSGLLEQMTKKDYMAGMPELLTKLYDGKMQKRLLRKETIEVQNPRLLIFAGGIKDKVTSLLTFEQVSSGFMPRFIFITAESDLTRVKPLGPPTSVDLTNRNAILDEMADLYKHYNASTTVHITKLNADVEQTREWNAELTPEAWERYNLLESQMLQTGLASQRADVMTPTYDRLSKSILKAAVLLAAARQRGDVITVELDDMLRAILYGEEWKAFAKELIAQVGKGGNERQLDLILGAVVRQPGISRSVLMQRYHLTSRNATEIFGTLEDRGMIVIQRQGKGQVLYPNERNLSNVG